MEFLQRTMQTKLKCNINAQLESIYNRLSSIRIGLAILQMPMKRSRKVIVTTIFTVMATSLFLALAFFLPIPLGAPVIDVELGQTPPLHIRPGESVRLELSIANDAWLLAAAKDAKVTVNTPEGLTVSGTNTNEYQINIGTLRGGESWNCAFNVTANISLLPGTYSATITIFGQNMPQKILTPEVVVELPHAQ